MKGPSRMEGNMTTAHIFWLTAAGTATQQPNFFFFEMRILLTAVYSDMMVDSRRAKDTDMASTSRPMVANTRASFLKARNMATEYTPTPMPRSIRANSLTTTSMARANTPMQTESCTKATLLMMYFMDMENTASLLETGTRY